MYWDTVHTGLGPGPVSLADLGGLVAVPHLVAREAGDGGLAPEAGALRPDLGLGRGRGRTAGERLAGEIRAVPSEDGQCLSESSVISLSPDRGVVMEKTFTVRKSSVRSLVSGIAPKEEL